MRKGEPQSPPDFDVPADQPEDEGNNDQVDVEHDAFTGNAEQVCTFKSRKRGQLKDRGKKEQTIATPDGASPFKSRESNADRNDEQNKHRSEGNEEREHPSTVVDATDPEANVKKERDRSTHTCENGERKRDQPPDWNIWLPRGFSCYTFDPRHRVCIGDDIDDRKPT